MRNPARGAGRIGFAAGAVARILISFALAGAVAGCLGSCGGKSQKLGERVIPFGQKVPKGGGYYSVGKPYEIAGVTYVPREDASYNRVGLASWYGELFHGRRTANGEIYDMDRLSAAHPTLPLPVYARVTNLNNGRSIVVRVNDRGPFANDRIIDLSKHSAEMLGFRRNGTAVVRVAYLGRAPLNGDDSYERRYLAGQSFMQVAGKSQSGAATERREQAPVKAPQVTAALTGKAASSGRKTSLDSAAMTLAPAEPATTGSVAKPGVHIQAGMFKVQENVDKAREALSPIASVEVTQVEFGGDMLTRVRVGPFPDKRTARAALGKVTRAGYRGAKIVH